MNQHDEFDFAQPTIEPDFDGKYPSVGEMRNLLTGHDPGREQRPTIAKSRSGVVTRLENSFGVIRSDDGHGVFFSPSNVIGFDDLRTGDRVTFELNRTQHGIKAENVSPIPGM